MSSFVVPHIIIISIIVIVATDLHKVGWRDMGWIYLAQNRDG